jgi:hypothetical protein
MMERTGWKRCAKAGLVVAVACILPLGCASSTVGVADRPDEFWSPAIPSAPEVDTLHGERLDASPPPSDPGMQERAAGIDGEVTSASSPVFVLDIELGSEPRFRVLSEQDVEPAEVITIAADSHGPEVAAALTASLTYMADQNRVPASLQISFKPLTWDDLDAWEKAGLVASYASSVVGAAYFLYSLFD